MRWEIKSYPFYSHSQVSATMIDNLGLISEIPHTFLLFLPCFHTNHIFCSSKLLLAIYFLGQSLFSYIFLNIYKKMAHKHERLNTSPQLIYTFLNNIGYWHVSSR